MHDSATHNSNAAHDDADINTDGNVDDVERFCNVLLFYDSRTKPLGGLKTESFFSDLSKKRNVHCKPHFQNENSHNFCNFPNPKLQGCEILALEK